MTIPLKPGDSVVTSTNVNNYTLVITKFGQLFKVVDTYNTIVITKL